MHGTYIGNNKVLVSTKWGGMLTVNAEDLSLAPVLIIHGIYDAGLTNYLIKNIKKGDTVVDIGANLGYFTTLMGYLVGPIGKVLAYEANPSLIPLIQDNISMNYIGDRVTVYNKAIYSEYKTMPFFVAKKFMGNSSLHKHDSVYFNNYKSDTIQEIQVDAEPLDAIMDNVDVLSFVKIDIEGGEYHALKGMEKLLESNKIETFSFELNRKMLQNDWYLLYAFLKAYEERMEYYLLNNNGDILPISLDDLFMKDGIPNVIVKVKRNI